jgi:TolB protein
MVFTGALLLSTSGVAEATFPGANGKIAFTRYAGAPTYDVSIYSVNPDGTGLGQVASDIRTIGPVPPSWRADGRKIAVALSDGTPTCWDPVPSCEIDVMNPDGSGRVDLTPQTPFGLDGDISPAWSPDGSRLAFERGRDITQEASYS